MTVPIVLHLIKTTPEQQLIGLEIIKPQDGLPVELYKAGGDELIGHMNQLICKMCLEKCIPYDSNLISA